MFRIAKTITVPAAVENPPATNPPFTIFYPYQPSDLTPSSQMMVALQLTLSGRR
jgi:hypothetical protein